MQRCKGIWLVVTVWLHFVLSANVALAHVFWVESELDGAAKKEIEASVFMGHPDTPDSNIIMALSDSTVYLPDGSSTPLRMEKSTDHWRASIPARETGAYVIAAARAPSLFDPQWHGMTGPARLMRDSAKTIVCNGPAANWDRTIGQELEIVPLVDPCGITVGEKFQAMVLRNGTPVAGEYSATTSGHNIHDKQQLQTGKVPADGKFSVQIEEAGLWLIMVEVAEDQAGTWTAGEDLVRAGVALYRKGEERRYENVKYRAMLTFRVPAPGTKKE